eukprot:1562548-Rhodomonas_salina.1
MFFRKLPLDAYPEMNSLAVPGADVAYHAPPRVVSVGRRSAMRVGYGRHAVWSLKKFRLDFESDSLGVGNDLIGAQST